MKVLTFTLQFILDPDGTARAVLSHELETLIKDILTCDPPLSNEEIHTALAELNVDLP